MSWLEANHHWKALISQILTGKVKAPISKHHAALKMDYQINKHDIIYMF